MFSFLKSKLKSAVSSFSKAFSKKAEEETKPEEAKPVQPTQKLTETPAKTAAVKKKPTAHPGHPPAVEKVEKIPAESKAIVEKDAPKPGHEQHPPAIERVEKIPEESGKLLTREEKKETKTAEIELPKSQPEQPSPKPSLLQRLKETFTGKTEASKPEAPSIPAAPTLVVTAPEKIQAAITPSAPQAPEKQGLFGKIKQAITTTRLSGPEFEDLFQEMELALLESNVAVEVVDKIREDLRSRIVDRPIPRGEFDGIVLRTLKDSISDAISIPSYGLLDKISNKKPYVICFLGVNGSGKTTSIAKVAHMLKEQGLGVVIAAADTFRAAAIDQLEEHSNRLGVKLIKHDYGADPAAVAFDAVKHAQATGKDVVLIDTAGRLHSNTNLMDELRKVVRVAKPDLKIFVGESITGNDCIEQARQFDDAVSIDGIILSKADIDEKGGAAVSVSFVTKKPILYLGVGQEYGDLQKFEPGIVLDNLGLA